MFGIGLPEMIVILAVALIVVGPEKLPDMARNVAKWMFELKKTVNQVKESLTEEDNLIGSVHSDLKKTADDLKGNLIESDENFTWHEPGTPNHPLGNPEDEVIDMRDLKPVDKTQTSGKTPDQETSDKDAATEVYSAENGVPQQDEEAAEPEAGEESPEKPA